ncbi:hypothetical protein HAX54_040188 [Datura stramonium]|uniref:Uncharacterized protein n=1 Tax=Datura stramonium TaxID=4076 RepID=A0ABS8VNM8_DATST|nr:hypothetical protein [Datura stramonium]
MSKPQLEPVGATQIMNSNSYMPSGSRYRKDLEASSSSAGQFGPTMRITKQWRVKKIIQEPITTPVEQAQKVVIASDHQHIVQEQKIDMGGMTPGRNQLPQSLLNLEDFPMLSASRIKSPKNHHERGVKLIDPPDRGGITK